MFTSDNLFYRIYFNGYYSINGVIERDILKASICINKYSL